MRDDMFKVLVERPRWGAGRAPSVKLKKDRTPDRKSIGLKRHVALEAAYSKSLNENLAPLVRFLRSQRGRRWDDVFSDICAGLDTGSTVKMHVRMHLDDFVMTRISRGRNGELLHDGRSITPRPGVSVRDKFYVDPNDGILKDGMSFWRERGEDAPSIRIRRRRPLSNDAPELRWIGRVELLLRRSGCWFLYRLDVRPDVSKVDLRNALLDGTWRDQADWAVVAHHQLSKRELKRYELASGEASDD